jgi:hypothetical protein
LLLFLDPGSEIRDPGSGIRDPGWVKIRIRDKHPGSATLKKGEGNPKVKEKEKQRGIRTQSRIRNCENQLGEDEVILIFLPIRNY